MNTPDKIYLHGYEFSERPVNSWSEKQTDGIKGHKAINVEYIRKGALLELVNKKLQESADRLDYRTNKAYAEILDKLNEM